MLQTFNFIKEDIKDNIGWNEYTDSYFDFDIVYIVDGRNEQVLVLVENEEIYFNYSIPFYIFEGMTYKDLKKSFDYNHYYNAIPKEMDEQC